MKDERVIGVPQLVWGGVKLVFFAAILATPLAAAWLSSSLAAFYNQSPRTCVLAALLLFPIFPVAWEGIGAWRHEGTRSSRLVDRLLLRTLFLNVVFLGGLLWQWPAQCSVALSTRGDWFLDGRSGPAVDTLRSALFGAARGLDWLHKAVQPNPYVKKAEDDKPVVAKPEPLPIAKPKTDKPPEPTPIAPTALWPQQAELHHAVREMQPADEASIETVGLYLRAHSSGPTDRMKAIHDYVADRIVYDVPALSLPRVPQEDGDAETVFRRKLGVCAGYARLMRAIGAVTGDQIEYIGGDARVAMDDSPDGNGHAWNAAFVDGRWQLIDATWDAGYVDGSTFYKRYSTDYLFTPPEVFGIGHQPDDDAWQLREHPIERGTFMRQPMLDPGFYRHGLRLIDPDRSQVTVTGAFDAHVQRPSGMFLMADARRKGDGAKSECTVSGTDTLAIHCPLAAGTYVVNLFDSPKQYGSYASIGAFGVNVSGP